ncbi:cell wall hydrolase [Sphingomicrobium sp. XHP0235]|uniref:cell wall hydrolase n=1 Tax=Sphingomicrobium aquimarinum TaxID=3133971 RepID=UPI0031FE7BB1
MTKLFSSGFAPVIGAALLATAGGAQVHANLITSPVLTDEQRAEFLDRAKDIADDKPLYALVAERKGIADAELDAQEWCLANAVYFEARGESLEGQLAVADVVMNRTDSERYPDNWCDVVKQYKQFSFVENRRFPRISEMQAWDTAKAVAKVAIDGADEVVRGDVLWYHADYVAPRWRTAFSEVTKVGVHIFYRA